ncbi:MAG: T9SS type A sorting domain-containing protein [Candidatus Kapaibacterium sp.]|jgi:hypothetical protein
MKSLLSLFIVLTVSTSFAQQVQWHKMSHPLHYTPTDIKKAGDMLYMTTLENTYFASEDNGDTWKIVSDWKPLMTAQTTGSAHFIDENNNIIMYPGMSSLSQLLQSNDKGNTWKSLTIIGRSNILSITNWKKGFIGISSDYSENRGHILIHDTTQKNINTYYEENLFGKCFTLDSVYFINYSGIYSSPFDTIIPKKIIHFPNKTRSFSLYMKDTSCFITAENFLFFSHDNGKTWEKDTLPFIAKHIQKNSRNFYAIDKENHLWKLSNDGRQWGKFLSFPLAHDSITCFYADNDQLFFGGSKGLLRYSLRNSTWLNQSELGSVSSYMVKLTGRGICVSPNNYNLRVLPSGFCYTTNLGKSWVVKFIHPYGWGFNHAGVYSQIMYQSGTFYYYSEPYNSMMSFDFKNNWVSSHVNFTWQYHLQQGDTLLDIHRKFNRIQVRINDTTFEHSTALPESFKYSFDNYPQLTFSLIKDTLFYSLNDSIRERKKYFSINFGKSWSLYNNWKKKYAATGVPLRFGKYIRRFHPSEGFQIYNPRNDSWHTINDSRWGTMTLRDMDFNDSLIVVGHPTGVYYLTPDDIPALTDIQESPSVNNSISIYPIPFDDKLNINALSEDAELTLYSVMGLPVLSQKNDNNTLITLETALIPRGIYFLEIKTRHSSVKYSVLKL